MAHYNIGCEAPMERAPVATINRVESRPILIDDNCPNDARPTIEDKYLVFPRWCAVALKHQLLGSSRGQIGI